MDLSRLFDFLGEFGKGPLEEGEEVRARQ